MGRRARDREDFEPLSAKATALDTSLAWLNWVDQVPLEARQELADAVMAVDVREPEGVAMLAQVIMKHMILGDLDIAVAQELRNWANILVSLSMAKTGATNGTSTESFILAAMQRTTNTTLVSTLHSPVITAIPAMERTKELA